MGLSVILGNAGKGGIRIGATWHRFVDEEEPFWLVELGFLIGRSANRSQ